MDRVLLPVYMPAWLHGLLRRAKGAFVRPAPPPNKVNIWGERQVEWSFISSHLPAGPGEALDFGCEFGYLSLLAARKGFRVTALDLQQQNFPWRDPNVSFLQGDLLEISLPEGHFDLIIDCSSVEHVGLSGRYGITEGASDGDLAVMRRFHQLLKQDGTLLATMPCGRDTVVAPWHRVYGRERLPRLLDGFHVAEQSFWVKDEENRWNEVDRETALDFAPGVHPIEPEQCSYALGCFVLTKNGSDSGGQGGA
jgi:SAM-dependent methyltransferase